MASEISTIQSLRAVDAWIDVINANINGGVRTAFKASRLKFSGSNTDVSRAGTSTGLPLQFPEPGLTTANTVIDFSQGAITASSENTHLAIQGEGYFLLLSPDAIDTTPGATFGCTKASATARMLLTRDGEFHTNQYGLLVNAQGYYPVSFNSFLVGGVRVPEYANNAGNTGLAAATRAIYDNLDTTPPVAGGALLLSEYLTGSATKTVGGGALGGISSLVVVKGGEDLLQYSSYGSTVFDFGFTVNTTGPAASQVRPGIMLTEHVIEGTSALILNKSLEASNASMTQSVPELSLAQKLFSALTKVLQTKQTNVDGVLNLVR